MAWQRDFIEEMRRQKFSIGSSIKQPLAAELHRALINLSTELYQNDMHFLKEIIQNAEDNTYERYVRPSLEFLLTNKDVAEMGVSATLLVLNNEVGLTRSDVEALCSVKKSTKTGKRDKGYIGCKGIGFKSVFMVSKTPVLISNGFRIRFQDGPSDQCEVGYIVPEWTDSPTDDAILAICGHEKVPATVIILPLRQDKVDLVQRQLKGISPENILFLSKIRELQIVNEMEEECRGKLRIIRSEPISGIASECSARVSNVEVKVTYKFFRVNLEVTSDYAEDSDTFPYLVFQGAFPVTHPSAGREEVHDWAIGLAFPLEGRASDNVGDVFSFLPTEQRTGFPFIVNADFILTSSRESIRVESTWNQGILDCIPAAFEIAFGIMMTLEAKMYISDRRDIYMFLPVNSVENAYRYSSIGSVDNRHLRQKLHVQPQQSSNIHRLEKIRAEIFQRLENCNYIFLSSPGIENGLQLSKAYDLPAKSCFLIKPSFREILKMAAACDHPAPSVVLDGSKSKFGIVDKYVQEKYASGLAALGVSEMGMAEYKSFLLDADWLINLPEKIYVQVLGFFAIELKLLDNIGNKLNLLKIRTGTRQTRLTSFADLVKSEVFYNPSTEDADWIYEWVQKFSDWESVEVMPVKASVALIEASNSRDLMTWIRKRISLTELSVRKYSERLIEKLKGPRVADRNTKDSKFSVLVLQFLYSGIHDKKLPRRFVVESIKDLRHVIVLDASDRERSASYRMREDEGLLLPSVVSEWPTLFTCDSYNSKQLITLSDAYMKPQCPLVRNVVTESPGPDSMLKFIKDALGAVDLPLIKLPAGEPLSFCYPVTMEKSLAMLEWLKELFPNRKTARRNDKLLSSVKEFAWVKTYHHGWQLPTSVFFSVGYFQDRFTAHDLPFLDVPAYADLDLTDSATQTVFDELNLVTDVGTGEGRAAVVKYLSECSAKKLDLEAVSRFYTYLHEIASQFYHYQKPSVKICVPAGATRKEPMWKDPPECIISDELGICADTSIVTVLDTIYGVSLIPFFSKMHVPAKASGAVYCRIWCEWNGVSTTSDKVKEEDGHSQNAVLISRVKAQHVLKEILHSWQDSSSKDSRKGPSSTVPNKDSGSKGSSDTGSSEVWKSFYSRAWVPVAPVINELVSEANATISIVPPSQVLIADDLELSKSFSAVANGKLNLVWLLPGLPFKKRAKLVRMYSKMGVRKISELVTCHVRVPPDVWKKKVSRGKGLIWWEGLSRIVLDYLCKNEETHGLSLEGRQQILSPLLSTTEIVVGEPLEKNFCLHVGTSTFSVTAKQNVFAHYNKGKRKLYCLGMDHALLEGAVSKRKFSSQIATTVSSGILSEHPELVQGLTVLLRPLVESGFSTKAVERR